MAISMDVELFAHVNVVRIAVASLLQCHFYIHYMYSCFVGVVYMNIDKGQIILTNSCSVHVFFVISSSNHLYRVYYSCFNAANSVPFLSYVRRVIVYAVAVLLNDCLMWGNRCVERVEYPC